MKKLLTIIVSIMLVFSVGACGTSDKTEEELVVADQVEDLSDDQEDLDEVEEDEVEDEVEEESDAASTIEEKIIYESNDIKVTVTSLDHSSLMGPEIKMLFENNGDKDVTIQTGECSINGYMVSTMMSVNVAAGKKANDSLTIMEDSLSKSGIGRFTDIKFSLNVLDSSSFERIDESDMIALETSYTGKYTQEYDDSGDVIYDENNIKIVSKGIEKDDIFGQALSLYIENNSDKTVVVQCDNASVNGFMISSIFSSTILLNTKAIDQLTFLGTSLEENGIEDIESIELKFIIIDSDDYGRIAESEMTTIEF